MADLKISDMATKTTPVAGDLVPILNSQASNVNAKATIGSMRAALSVNNVDNTSDVNKPVSNPTQTALNLKADASALTTHTGNTSNPHAVTKAQVGLGSVPNTDATARSNHTGTQLAATISDFAEAVDDRVGVLIVAGRDFQSTYTDIGDVINMSVRGPVTASPAYATPYTPTLSANRSDHVVEMAALTGPLTVNAPTGATPLAGDTLKFVFTQDATGGRVVTWNAAYVNAPAIASAANAKTLVPFLYTGTIWILEP